MKNFFKISLFALTIFIISCEAQNIGISGISGKWKLVESLGSIGDGKQVPLKIDNKTFIEFSSNGDLSGSGAKGFVKYRTTDSTIVFIRSDNTEQNYAYKFEDNRLVMRPAGPMYCIEGCSQIYKKVN